MTGITYPSSSTNSFSYNCLDTRVGKTDSSGTATYQRDGIGVTSPVLTDGAETFTPGISQRSGSTSTFDCADRLGTFGLETNSSQSTTGTRQFDAFGNSTSTSGSPSGPFGFAGAWGYQQDGDSGLKLLGHRYYDSSTGRFLTRDPAMAGENWYGYARNNPLRWADPSGLWLEELGKWQTWADGLTTAGAGLLLVIQNTGADVINSGLIVPAPGIVLGSPLKKWDGGEYAGRPGFTDSTRCWDVAQYAVVALAGDGIAGLLGKVGGDGVEAVDTTVAGFKVSPDYLKVGGDLYHSGPDFLADIVFNEGKVLKLTANYVEFGLDGSVNGASGTWQLGITNRFGEAMVSHWFFDPL